MADRPGLVEIVRQATLLNLRFYQSAVDLSLNYLRDLGAILRIEATPSGAAGAANAQPTHDSGVVVLEAEAGQVAKGAFVVSNELDRAVSLKMDSGAFTDPNGGTVEQALSFAPPTVELAAGGRQVVTASAQIGDALSPGLAYRGEVAIEGMKGFTVPVVLRRRNSIADASASSAPSRSGKRAQPARS